MYRSVILYEGNYNNFHGVRYDKISFDPLIGAALIVYLMHFHLGEFLLFKNKASCVFRGFHKKMLNS